MKVFVLGNKDVKFDSRAFSVARKIGNALPKIELVILKPNEDLPFVDVQDVIVMDVVEGLTKVTLMQNADLEKIILPPRGTAHDYDLGFQLRYLKKLGRLGKVTIIGLPMTGRINYTRIQSILRKLVAQDIHGS